MSLLRSRVFSTLVLFAIGAGLGYLFRDAFAGRRPPPAARPAAERLAGTPSPEPPQAAAEDDGLLTDEPEAVPDADDPLPASPPEPAAELVTPSAQAQPGLVRGEEAGFFRSPSNYAGRDLEMELQMITAKKLPGKWRLNLVYAGPGREIEYLYVDDAELLGEAPDLRIGYAYKVRFRCGSGVTTSGNTLLFIAATGRRADWATGISAVE